MFPPGACSRRRRDSRCPTRNLPWVLRRNIGSPPQDRSSRFYRLSSSGFSSPRLLSMARPSIYELAGGDAAFLALAAAHHERCLQEPEISHAFSHGFNPDHVENLAFYWAEVFGGPARYSEAHGGHSGMLEVHARTGAAEDWGQRFVACFVQAVDEAGLPEDAEVRAAVRPYIECASAEE